MSNFHENALKKVGSQHREGQGCLICGDTPVTREHVIPKWLQKKKRISSQRFQRPNGSTMTYGQLKVSLCATCNNQDFSRVESFVSKIFATEIDPNYASSGKLQIWLIKIYYFLQLFEHSRLVHRPGLEPASLVDDDQLFDLHLLQILLKSASAKPTFTYPNLDFASVWLMECSTNWDRECFAFASYSGQNIIAMKIGAIAVFSVVGDWGQYKKGGALESINEPVEESDFLVCFELLRFFVYKNGISTSFGISEAEDSNALHLLPLMIMQEDMDFSLDGFADFTASECSRG